MSNNKSKQVEQEKAIHGIEVELVRLRRDVVKFQKCVRQATGELKKLLRSMPRIDPKTTKSSWAYKIPPKGALRYPHIQKLVIQQHKAGRTFREIAIEARKLVPVSQRNSLSKSSLHRFYHKAQRGGYRAFGIEGWDE